MKVGLAVMREGASPLWRVESASARAIRLPLVHWADVRPYLEQARGRGWDVLGVLDRDAWEDWGDWRRSADRDLERIDELYIKSGLVTHLALGNECDDGWRGPGMHDDPMVQPRGGISSWVMSFAEQGEMVDRAWERFKVTGESRTRVPLVLGGLSSGQPSALEHFDLAKLAAVQVHPYGKAPSPDWPREGWRFGFVGYLLDGMREILDRRGVSRTCRLGIGELGLSSYEEDPGLVAEWHRRMLQYLRGRGDVDFCFAFCDSDHNVDGYGLFDVSERPKPALAAVSSFLAALPEAPLLIVPDGDGPIEEPDEPDEPVDPEEPLGWFDEHFSATELAGALAAVRTALGRPTRPDEVEADIRANWPEFGPWLATYGVAGEPQVKIGLLATIWVECIWELRPRDELGDYDRFERLYGHQTAAGRALGNLYAGDGARYKGRGYQLTGRGNYAHTGEVLGVDLVGNPEAANDPTIAAGATALFFAERGMFELCKRGDWAAVRRRYNGGLNGFDGFMRAVQALQSVADANADAPPPQADLGTTLRRVLEIAATRIGDPYVWDGERPGAFDCSGFIKWVLGQLGIPITSYTDAIHDETDPISEAQALPGDIVLYEYRDPSQSNTRFPHVGFVTERPDITLDARWGVGVGYHAHVAGALRRYRRVRGLSAVEDPEEMVWKEKAEGMINALAYLGDDVADELEIERSKLDDYGDPPRLVAKKPGKPTIAELQAHRQAMDDWAAKVRGNTDARYKAIGTTGQKLRDVRTQFVGPRPTPA